MTLSRIGRATMALLVSVAMGLGITSCGGGTIGFMWVIGAQHNQIGGFKIDSYTGNLTGTVGSPYSAPKATNPVMLTLKSGGRYLYVLYAGDSTGKTGTIALFSVGGDGTLSYQQSYTSQGTFPVWITTDSSGSFLYVLDQHSPAYDGVTDLNGSITAFSLDPNTGRPSLVTNAQVKNASGTQITYFEVGKSPIEMRSSSQCLLTLDSGDQSVFPYAFSTGNGQLTQPANSTLALGSANATSINYGGGSFVYVTDAGSTTGGPGTILAFTQGTSCALSPVGSGGGSTPNLSPGSYPIQTLSTTDGKYFYVLNRSTADANYANSSISGFSLTSPNGVLQPVSTGDLPNPYSVGSGPVCMAIDPTNQYIYTADQISSTITGKRLSNTFGNLSNLQRGSSFPTVGTPTCLVISGNTGY